MKLLILTTVLIKLSFLWLNLEQNLFKQDSRGTALVPLTGSRNGGQGQNFLMQVLKLNRLKLSLEKLKQQPM